MYFNDGKEDTNIDDEFEENKFGFLRNINNKWIKVGLLSLGALLFVVIIIVVVINNKQKNTFYLILKGEEEITIYCGSDYIEMGYQAFNKRGDDFSDKVVTTGNLDRNKIGEYLLTYTIKNVSKNRLVKVIEKPMGTTNMFLLGDVNYFLEKGNKYVEPGYIVVDSIDSNLTNDVIVSGIIDEQTKGSYRLVYSVVNSSGVTTSTSRIIFVVDPDIILKLNPSSATNGSVKINITSSDPYFEYYTLPDGSKSKKINSVYTVNANGNYTFSSYNSKGMTKQASISVKNIDTVAPTGSCKAFITNSSTVVSVKSSDASGIKGYIYTIDGKKSAKIINTSYSYSAKANSASVAIYDNANNVTNVTCSISSTPTPSTKTSSSSSSFSSSSKPSSSSTRPVTGLVSVDLTDIGCPVYYSNTSTIFKTLTFSTSIADNAKNVLRKICAYSKQNAAIKRLETAGAYVNKAGMHGKGLAIDMFNTWNIKNGSTTYYPYGGQGSWTWQTYNKFICDMCNGDEDCKYNINYQIWKKYFEPAGWCWGGNWGVGYFDPMHYEYSGSSCSVRNKSTIKCN